MSRLQLTIKLIKTLFPTRFTLAKLTELPVIGKIVDKMFFEGDALRYLPKDELVKEKVTLELKEPLEAPDTIVVPSRVVEYFIRKSDYIFRMDFCICRKSEGCEEYPRDLGCIFLGESARRISTEVGEPITEEEALRHVQKCREAGLIHLIGKNKLDHVWLNTGPVDHLLTICNCCECCCLWRMLPYLNNKIGERVKKMPGVRVQVTEDCIGCGTCVETCFVNVIQVNNGKASIGEDCRGCGRCITACPNDAIKLSIENEDFIEKTIAEIEHVVDVSNN